MSKYTVLVVKDMNIETGEFNPENVVSMLDGDMLLLGVAKKNKDTNIVYTQPYVIGNYEDLARVHLTVGSEVLKKFREVKSLPDFVNSKEVK